MHHQKSKHLMYFLPFAILAIGFMFVPLGSVLINSLTSHGEFVGLGNFKEVLTDAYILQGIKNSLTLSGLSVVMGIIISFLGAYLIYTAKEDSRFRRFFLTVLNMTSNFQGVQLAFAFMILLGNAGVLVLFGKKFGLMALGNYDLYTASGLLITFVYFQIPLGILLLYPAFSSVEKQYQEAAEILGCKGWKFWWKVGIPILLPAIWGTAAILFANAMAAYATPYAILGSNYPLMGIQISGMFTGDIVQQVDKGSAMSVVLMLFTIIISYVARKITPKYQRGTENGKN